MAKLVDFELSYTGGLSDEQTLDFYDASQALVGFQRSLALSAHLVFTGEVITQAPSLKGAEIRISPPEDGSWKVTATVIGMLGAGVYALGTAPRDTPLGHLISSAYDYVVSETLGFHVDYEKTLGEQIEERREEGEDSPHLSESKFDSLIEKCEPAVRMMHRPLVASKTASKAHLSARIDGESEPIGPPFSRRTYEYIAYTSESARPSKYAGRISSYNINTFRGRIYLINEERPVPFELATTVRDLANVRQIINSLGENAQWKSYADANIVFSAFSYASRTGRIKRLFVVGVERIASEN